MNTEDLLAAAGLTQTELADRIVEQVVGRLLNTTGFDEDGDETGPFPSSFDRELRKKLKDKIDDAVESIAGRHVLPNVESYVENLCLQETNQWGEKRGEPVTFVEYLVQRADAYLNEDVNYKGMSKKQGDSYGWRKDSTRIAHMVHEHLHHSIERAMKEAVTNANESIAGGIAKAVKISLAEISKALKVNVQTT